MVRINLLKNSALQKAHRRFPLVPVLVILGVVVVAGGGAAAFLLLKPAKVAEVIKPVTVTDSEMTPSSHTRSTIVEDVVKDVQDTQLTLKETGLLSLPYSQLSFEEKANYQMLFARTVFDMIGRVMPGDIVLETVSWDSFTTIRARGIGPSRGAVSAMLSALKKERLTILPKPHTTIANAAEGGFRFTLTLKPDFGLNLKDPAVDLGLADVGSRTSAADVLDEIRKIAAGNGIKLAQPLKITASVRSGKYRQLSAPFSATGGFKEFVAFVVSMQNHKKTCAFDNLRLVGQAGGRVSIKADLILTVKD